MSTILGAILTLLVIGVTSGLIIWIVSKLGLGLEVDGFGSAFIAAIVIAIVAAGVHWVTNSIGLTGSGNWLAVIVNIIVAAVILLIADKLLAGLKVAGFVGALVAAIAIGVISGIFAWMLSFV